MDQRGAEAMANAGITEADLAGRHVYRVAFSAADDEYVATCDRFPSLSWLAPDPVSALDGLYQMIVDVELDLAADA